MTTVEPGRLFLIPSLVRNVYFEAVSCYSEGWPSLPLE